MCYVMVTVCHMTCHMYILWFAVIQVTVWPNKVWIYFFVTFIISMDGTCRKTMDWVKGDTGKVYNVFSCRITMSGSLTIFWWQNHVYCSLPSTSFCIVSCTNNVHVCKIKLLVHWWESVSQTSPPLTRSVNNIGKHLLGPQRLSFYKEVKYNNHRGSFKGGSTV